MAGDVRGIDLRLLRTYKRLTVAQVARHAGFSRQRLSAIEGTDRPTPEAVARVRVALQAAEAARSR
jgi:transcriptional regulator with XRE-family HTH domain